jgi:glucose/arabinose dehydrogenase
VASKSGVIQTFDGLDDPTPTVFADLRSEVHNYWDRGLLGMELDFYYSEYPWVYVLYTHDAEIGGTAPTWGTPGGEADPCPTPPGPNGDGCVVSGRLSRLVPEPGGGVREDVLIEDWCQQYPSHSVGSLEFDQWGALYASAGDGASFSFVDYGQDGDPVNPCGDPGGSSPTPPGAQGGALRSQDVRTAGDPMSLDGSVIRVNSDGAPSSINPMYSSSDPNAQRVIASGLRNPFRFDVADDGDLWVGDVGWAAWEEINRVPYSGFTNLGWPCYEGGGPHPGYDAADLAICEGLYASPGAVTPPYYAYGHSDEVVPDEDCRSGTSSISGVRFYRGTSFPGAYSNALFFADYSRHCIWAMLPGADGDPDPSRVVTFDAGASFPVWLENGPDGALYYADFDGGRIQRIQYTAGNQSPTAVIDADHLSGPAPLTVHFDGSGSSDPDGDPLTYAWDLDGDGQTDDSDLADPDYTFDAGSHPVELEVSDGKGGIGTASVTVDAGNSPPTPTISAPLPATRWRVGQRLSFSGAAQDPEEGALPASALRWDVVMRHCPSSCHSHGIESFPGVANGSFAAPDHEHPSHLLLRLTATDAGGLTATKAVRLNPRTVNLTLSTNWTATLNLVLNGVSRASPSTTTLIKGSNNSITAPSPQTRGGYRFTFSSWSDGGARTHNVTASSTRTIQANFARKPIPSLSRHRPAGLRPGP